MGCKSSCVFDTSTCFKGILNPEKAATENKTAAEKLKKQETDFSTDKNVLRFSLKSGDSMKDSFTITNTKDKSDLEIEVPEDLKTILSADKTSITLDSGESKKIEVSIITSGSIHPGIYTGKIRIRGGSIEKAIDVIVEIISKKALFDVKLDISSGYNAIEAGGKIKSQISMVDIGDIGNVDVSIKYYIKNMDNRILLQESETRSVNGYSVYTKEFSLPPEADPGNYLLYVEIEYGGSVAVSSQLFAIIGFKETGPVPVEIISALTILVISVVLFSIIVFRKTILWN